MILNIISQEKIIYQGEVLSVNAPGIEGELTILPNHTPLITILKKGEIKLVDEEKKKSFFSIEKGILEVRPQEVNILI